MPARNFDTVAAFDNQSLHRFHGTTSEGENSGHHGEYDPEKKPGESRETRIDFKEARKSLIKVWIGEHLVQRSPQKKRRANKSA